MVVKTRFCPSPTGLMHLGNTRTALFSALYAQNQQGTFLLRIEDTDKSRSQRHLAEGLMHDLRWLGLQWQEGPGAEQGHVSYWQSERQAIYDQFYGCLEEKGLAYPCFCTEEQLSLTRKVQQASGQAPRYPGTCRDLSVEQIKQNFAAGLSATLRFRVPDNEIVEFEDLVDSTQRFVTKDIGDFIIRRGDGTSPFTFCNAIDDALMGITHVLRGVDHLTNTPRQILILRALELPVASYGHISLIVGPDNSPLSKRNGSRSVQELREQGYLPNAIINYLARLGHHYEQSGYMELAELAQDFSLSALNRSPAHFDAEQLLYWQKEAIIQTPTQLLWEWIGDTVQQQIPLALRDDFINTIKPNIIFPHDALVWAEILFNEKISYDASVLSDLKTVPEQFFQIAQQAVEHYDDDYQKITDHLKSTLDLKGKALFQPLRLSLTGKMHGPELAAIFSLLGKEKILSRFKQASYLLK